MWTPSTRACVFQFIVCVPAVRLTRNYDAVYRQISISFLRVNTRDSKGFVGGNLPFIRRFRGWAFCHRSGFFSTTREATSCTKYNQDDRQTSSGAPHGGYPGPPPNPPLRLFGPETWLPSSALIRSGIPSRASIRRSAGLGPGSHPSEVGFG
jgi:hypothetical protein